LFIMWIKFIANYLSQNYLRNKYDKILWKDYCKPLSAELYKWVADSPAIYLGMDIDKLSTYTMLNLITENNDYTNRKGFYSFNGPINEVFFNKWIEKLIENGVEIRRCSAVTSINMEQKVVTIKSDLGEEEIQGDYIINSLPIEKFRDILNKTSGYEKYVDPICFKNYYNQMATLADQSRQIQTQVLVYLDKRLKCEKPTIIVLPDTEWFLMVRVEGYLWKNEIYMNTNILNSNDEKRIIKDILSIGIGIFSREGKYSKKAAIKCSIDEIKEECIAQLCKYEKLWEKLKFDDGSDFNRENIITSNIWKTFKTNESGILTTREPKFSNNVYTLALRPQERMFKEVNFMLNATSYCDTETHIFNMESGIEAGMRAANEVLKSEGKEMNEIVRKRKEKKIVKMVSKIWCMKTLVGIMGVIGVIIAIGIYISYN